MPEGERSTLFIEGDDDKHAIEHLLLKRRMRREAEWFPALEPVGSVEELLERDDFILKRIQRL